MPATSRANAQIGVDFPEAAGKRFGAVIESLGTTPAQIVVERAMYTSPNGDTWTATGMSQWTPLTCSDICRAENREVSQMRHHVRRPPDQRRSPPPRANSLLAHRYSGRRSGRRLRAQAGDDRLFVPQWAQALQRPVVAARAAGAVSSLRRNFAFRLQHAPGSVELRQELGRRCQRCRGGSDGVSAGSRRD